MVFLLALRAAILALASALALEAAVTFHVEGSDPAAWSRIFTSVGMESAGR